MRLVPKVMKPRPRAKVYTEDLEHSRKQGQPQQEDEEEGAIMNNTT